MMGTSGTTPLILVKGGIDFSTPLVTVFVLYMDKNDSKLAWELSVAQNQAKNISVILPSSPIKI